MKQWIPGMVVMMIASVVLTPADGLAQSQCKGTKIWYQGQCRYPDQVRSLKAAAKKKAADARKKATTKKKAAGKKKKKGNPLIKVIRIPRPPVGPTNLSAQQAYRAPFQGILFLRSETPDVRCVVNGAKPRKVPTATYGRMYLPLRSRPYRVVFKRTGYYPFETSVTLTNEHLAATVEHKMVPSKWVKNTGGQAVLQVTSQPSDAAVFIDGKQQAETTPASYLVPAGVRAVEVRKSGHRSVVRSVTVYENGITKMDDVMLAANTGRIMLASSADAVIYLDGKRVGIGKHRGDVDAGGHIVRVEKEGHKPIEDVVIVERGKDRSRRYKLLNNFGALTITSKPARSRIVLHQTDGSRHIEGTTPWFKRPVPIGTWELTVSHSAPHYRPLRRTVSISPDKTTSLSLRLAQRTGKLTIATQPPNARIYVDGEPVRSGTQAVTIGWRSVQATLAGHKTVERRVNVAEGQTQLVFLRLVPGANAPVVPEPEPDMVFDPPSVTQRSTDSGNVGWKWALGGLSVLSAAAGGTFFYLGSVEHDKAADAFKEYKSYGPEWPGTKDMFKEKVGEHVSKRNSHSTIGWVGVGAGVAGAAALVTLFLLEDTGDPMASIEGSFTLTPWVGLGDNGPVGLTLGGRF